MGVIAVVVVFVGGASASATYSTSSDYQKAVAGSWVRLEGQLQVVVTDFDKSSETSYFLSLGDLQIPLHFVSNPPRGLLTGTRVRVRGRKQRDGSLTLASKTSVKGGSGGSTTTTSAAPLPNTFGAQSTLVILVNFQDDPTNQPYTAASAQSVVFQSGNGSVNDFFYENSYGQTWLTGQVVGWYTIPVSSTSCDTSAIASDAQSAASSAGVNLSGYTRYVYAFPQNNNCGWGGESYIGGNPSQSWINGVSSGTGTLDVHIVDHEIGHALGLSHSHLLDCGTSATIGSNCVVNEYGDILDTMGATQTPAPHYNAFQKERLGWLNYGSSPAITTADSPGTYVINAYELSGSGPSALKVLKSVNPTTGEKTWYYIESRRAMGFDQFIANQTSENETDGVLVHIGTDGDGNSSDLLDMTPSTPTYYWWFDASLVTGQSFQDPDAGLTLTTDWATSTQAAVTVQFAGAITAATSQQAYSLGQNVSVVASAVWGGSPAANASVTFTITKANGSVVTGTAKTGSNGTATFNLKLKNTDPTGTYSVNVTAILNSASATGATTFQVTN